MRKRLFILCVCVLFLALLLILALVADPFARDSKTDRTTRYIENYVSRLKEIEMPASAQWNNFMRVLEAWDDNAGEAIFFELRDASNETVQTNKRAIEEFSLLARRRKPDYVEDTIHILLQTATVFLAQSYETRNEAMTWFNRYISLGTMRFFREYSEGMSQAMEMSRQAFFFITMARVRQRVVTGDTLDMTIEEFLNIPPLPELPEMEELSKENPEESSEAEAEENEEE
jgi:hypothetical protein